MERITYLISLTEAQASAVTEAATEMGIKTYAVSGPGEVPTSTDGADKLAFVPYFGPDTFGTTIENLVRRGVNGCVGILGTKSFDMCADAFRAGAEDVLADPFLPADVMKTLKFTAEGGLRRLEPMNVRPLQELEKDAIITALTACRGQVSLTARRLGIGRSTLYRKLEQYGINGNSG